MRVYMCVCYKVSKIYLNTKKLFVFCLAFKVNLVFYFFKSNDLLKSYMYGVLHHLQKYKQM